MAAAVGWVLAEATPKEPLAWDSISRKYEARRGETNLTFVFHFANVSSNEVVINRARSACDCTVPRFPEPLPWRLAPDANGRLDISVDLTERHEPFKQTVFVETSAGTNSIVLDIKTPELTPREKDQRAAFADRQAVFKARCADCHLKPAVGKPVEGQYQVLCGTCHESKQRAPMVPDLATSTKGKDRAYWDQWLRRGKPGTFMPAFYKPFGGPLTQDECDGLVNYLQPRFSVIESHDPKTGSPLR